MLHNIFVKESARIQKWSTRSICIRLMIGCPVLFLTMLLSPVTSQTLDDGQWGAWSSWSACPVTCGAGTVNRTRLCNNPAPKNGGMDCMGSDLNTEMCFRDPCVVDGGWSVWTSGICSTSCGDGVSLSRRTCTNPVPYNGRPCQGQDSVIEPCSTRACPVDGHWGEWTTTECAVTCGLGTQNNSRQCNSPPPSNNGTDCVGESLKVLPCGSACPVHGNWGEWVSGQCPSQCGEAQAMMSRTCDNPSPAYNGTDCPGDEVIARLCKLTDCPDYHMFSKRTLIAVVISIVICSMVATGILYLIRRKIKTRPARQTTEPDADTVADTFVSSQTISLSVDSKTELPPSLWSIYINRLTSRLFQTTNEEENGVYPAANTSEI